MDPSAEKTQNMMLYIMPILSFAAIGMPAGVALVLGGSERLYFCPAVRYAAQSLPKKIDPARSMKSSVEEAKQRRDRKKKKGRAQAAE